MIGQSKLPVPAEASQPLDLRGLVHTATIQPEDLALSLWVLSAPEPPPKIILPGSLLIRRRLARSGLVFAADRRGIAMAIEDENVPVPLALGLPAVPQTLALEQYDFETSDRMRVVSQLESPLRQPPIPDHAGRRYYWIDGLGVAAGHSERDHFDSHADQCLFELVDNVHRWAKSDRAIAIVSATSGGGEHSHNRLQIVVIDDGVGIVGSVKAKLEALTARGQYSNCICNEDKADAEIAMDVVTDLLHSVYGNRKVIGAQGGHGLNTIFRHVSQWNGTMNVISSFAPDRAMHLGRRGRDGEWSPQEFSAKGMSGTVIHFTLDAVRQEASPSPKLRRAQPAAA